MKQGTWLTLIMFYVKKNFTLPKGNFIEVANFIYMKNTFFWKWWLFIADVLIVCYKKIVCMQFLDEEYVFFSFFIQSVTSLNPILMYKAKIFTAVRQNWSFMRTKIDFSFFKKINIIFLKNSCNRSRAKLSQVF